MSDKAKSVLDVIGWCQELESRLEKMESLGELCIDSGEVHYDQDPLLTSGENKERYHRVKVKYNINFKKVLEVIPSIQRVDTHYEINSRFGVKVENVTNKGFDLIVGTWYPTKLWEIEVKWYAIGTREI